jgi:hypothetical protein
VSVEPGLAQTRLAPDGRCQLLTDEYFARDQWQAIEPWTMIGVVHDGHYFGFCRDYAFRLRIPDAVYEKPEDRGLTTLTLRPKAVYRSTTDRLYMVLDDDEGGGVYEWDAGNTFMTLRWRSSLLDMPAITRFSAFKIVHSHADAIVRHWVDGELIDEALVKSNHPQRLPLVAGQNWQFEIETKGIVESYSLGTSVRGLATLGD